MRDVEVLAAHCEALGLTLPAETLARLLQYRDELAKWNRTYNLTAIRDPQEMVTRHLLDSLAVLPFVGEGDTLDVGTGAGIPGIILAVSRPQQSFTLLDSNGKKTRFVRQARRELGLDNVEVVHGRVEQYRKAPSQIICRAFASLSDMLALMTSIMTDNTRLLAMKAASTEDELATLPAQWQGHHHTLTVPGLDEPRTLVVVSKA